MEVRLVPVETSEEIARCAVLAEEIWREHYRTLLSEEQITYMLKMFQSETAIREQIERENYRYSLFEVDGEPVGYFGWRPDEEGAFLSKLYVRRAARRQGLARMALEEIERETGKGRSTVRTADRSRPTGGWDLRRRESSAPRSAAAL